MTLFKSFSRAALCLCCLLALGGAPEAWAAPAKKAAAKPAAKAEKKPQKQDKKAAKADKPAKAEKTAKGKKAEPAKPAKKDTDKKSSQKTDKKNKRQPEKQLSKKDGKKDSKDSGAARSKKQDGGSRQTVPRTVVVTPPPVRSEPPPDQDELGELIRESTAAANRQPPPKPAAPPERTVRTEEPPSADTRAISRGDADELIGNAMGLLGVAYRFGGTSANTGFDCSGFMQHIFRKTFAVSLPRTSAEQARVGSYVARSDLQPGDLVFFRTSRGRISHVGMYVGNNRFIHAPRTGKRIEITSLSGKYWNDRYATARRVKRNNAGRFIR